MHFERHALDIVNLVIDRTELNGLMIQRKILAQTSKCTGQDRSVEIQVIENRIKTLLCLA